MADNGKNRVVGYKELISLLCFAFLVGGGWVAFQGADAKSTANAEEIKAVSKAQQDDHVDVVILKKDVKEIRVALGEIKADQKTMNISQQAMALEQKGIAFSISLILEKVKHNGGP